MLIAIGFFGLCMALAGSLFIQHTLFDRTQDQLKFNLKAAHAFYTNQLAIIASGLDMIGPNSNLPQIKNNLSLDYLYVTGLQQAKTSNDPLIRKATSDNSIGGTRIISQTELLRLDHRLAKQTIINVVDTPKAKPTNKKVVDSALAIEYVRVQGDRIYVGGKIINRDFQLIDRIHDSLFETRLYNNKPVGTVTIFEDDVRVSTNVLNGQGERAIGTRVSAKVYDNVVEKGKTWLDRAFVVTDWYITAYEPIRDPDGKIIGILYVGLLEAPFNDLRQQALAVFLVVVLLTTGLAILLALLIAQAILKPLTNLLTATTKMADGELEHRVGTNEPIREFNQLATAFNTMAANLAERDKNLNALNKRYLDLVGFVSHELKGILASTILNAYSVRDGFLGLVNFKQRRALDSITQNLDYLSSTVVNFLNLSRIEKGELTTTRATVAVNEMLVAPALENLSKLATEKEITFENRIADGVTVDGDATMLQIVINNLISNAIKYAKQAGKIILDSKPLDAGLLQFEVYNDGRPLSQEEIDRLFKRFTRLTSEETRKAKGTGLGLFITKEIVEKHGGKIWVESRTEGNAFVFTLERSK